MGAPDPVRTECPECGKKFAVPADRVGKKTRCPKCGAGVVVPIPLDWDEADPPEDERPAHERGRRRRHEEEEDDRPARNSFLARNWGWMTALAALTLVFGGVGLYLFAGGKKKGGEGGGGGGESMIVSANGLRYTTSVTAATLAEGEWLGLVVLVSDTGAVVDAEVASAGGSGTMSFNGRTVVLKSRVFNRAAGGAVGTRYVVDDKEKKVILPGKPFELDFDSAPPGATVTAAVGVYRQEGGDYRFVRFASPVQTGKVPDR